MEKPTLIAILDHDDCYIPEITERITQYGERGKTLAIETYPNTRSEYWGKFWRHAESLGMEVIPIDSKLALDIIVPFLEEKTSGAYRSPLDTGRLERDELEENKRQSRIRDGKFEYIITVLRDKFMIKRIQRVNPDLILCGGGHVQAIREAIQIGEYVQIGEYDSRLKKEDREIAKRIKEMLEERKKQR